MYYIFYIYTILKAYVYKVSQLYYVEIVAPIKTVSAAGRLFYPLTPHEGFPPYPLNSLTQNTSLLNQLYMRSVFGHGNSTDYDETDANGIPTSVSASIH